VIGRPTAFGILASFLLPAFACEPEEPPGELIGTYDIVGHLEDNTCGSTAMPAVNPLLFEAQIRDDDGVGVWIPPKGSAMVLGSISADGKFSFRQEIQFEVEQDTEPDYLSYDEIDPGGGASTCVLTQAEIIQGNVLRHDLEGPGDAGGMDLPDDGPELNGTNTIDVSAASGSDCSPSTSAGGGPFLALPCRIYYTLEGTRQPTAE
jgi:hypothetical protein